MRDGYFEAKSIKITHSPDEMSVEVVLQDNTQLTYFIEKAWKVSDEQLWFDDKPLPGQR